MIKATIPSTLANRGDVTMLVAGIPKRDKQGKIKSIRYIDEVNYILELPTYIKARQLRRRRLFWQKCYN